jgi:HD superfamily phosphohydrolase
MRDRQTCGVSYGNIPVEDLLRSLLPVLEQGRVRVAWRRSGVGAVERVIFEAYGMALHVHSKVPVCRVNSPTALRANRRIQNSLLSRVIRLAVQPNKDVIATLRPYSLFVVKF